MKSLMLIVEAREAVASIRTALGSTGAPVPPWLSFSGRWPWVTPPCQSTGEVKGSTAPQVALGVPGLHDPHDLVPRGVLGVVGRRDVDRVALVQRDAPIGPGRGHRHVPRHGAGRLEVLRLRAEQLARLAAAL